MSLLKTLNFVARHPLSKGRALRNFARFVRWQLGSRLVPGPVAFDFVNGAKLFARPGMTGATGNIYVGLHEFEDMAFALHFLRPDDLFVDVGANIGSYVVLASAAVGARSIAFEPSATAFHWLGLNIRLNAITELVDVRQQALGAHSGTALLTAGMDTVNHIVGEEQQGLEAGTIEVVISTMDAALEGKSPAMLKIDVEGFEAAVIDGAQRLLTSPVLRCLLIELTGHGSRYGFDERAVKSILERNGFETYRYLPRERRLVRNSAGPQTVTNTLFIRDPEFVCQRLRSAPPFAVLGQSI